jgi:hypothetical protein
MTFTGRSLLIVHDFSSWDESKHRREGGKFAPKGGGGASPKAPAKTGEQKTRSIAGLGSVTTGGGKTVIKVSWLTKVAAETAAGAALVAALPAAAVGAAGAAVAGVATKAIVSIGSKIGSRALVRAAGRIGTAVGTRAVDKAINSGAGAIVGNAGGLASLFRGVSVETEDGWFKPSTITIDRKQS